MKIFDIIEGKSENRDLWDRIKSKGVVPDMDRERYTDLSDEGLEGPFRMKNGQVLYYDPKEGKYYNRDTDMYVDYDDYKKMDEEGDLPNKKPADDVDSYADALIRRNKQNLNKGHVVNAARIAGVDEKQLMAAVNKKVGRIKEEGDKRPSYVVKASDKPKIVKPSMGGSSKHPYQGKLVGEAEVSNTDYELAHGKKPKGHGSWFFVAHRGGIDFSKDVEGEDYIELHQMSYGDAKKAAIKWAKSKGHPSLFAAT